MELIDKNPAQQDLTSSTCRHTNNIGSQQLSRIIESIFYSVEDVRKQKSKLFQVFFLTFFTNEYDKNSIPQLKNKL